MATASEKQAGSPDRPRHSRIALFCVLCIAIGCTAVACGLLLHAALLLHRGAPAGYAPSPDSLGKPLDAAHRLHRHLVSIAIGIVFHLLLGAFAFVRLRSWTAWLDSALADIPGEIGRWRSGAADWWRTESRFRLACLAAIVIVGAGLRVYYLSEPPRSDESLTYLDFANRSLYSVFTDYGAPNNHVFHSFLAWISLRVFGRSLLALRIPVLVAGIWIIPAAYFVGRRLFGPRAGILGSALCAVSPGLLLYSNEARGYGILTLLFLLSALAGQEAVARQSRAAWLAFCTLSVLGFWVAPFAVYPYFALFGWLFLVGRANGSPGATKSLAQAAAAVGIATAAAYMPIVVVSGPTALLMNRYVKPAGLAHFLPLYAKMPGAIANFIDWGLPAWLIAAIAVGFVASILLDRKSARSSASLAAAIALTFVVLPVAQRVVPFSRISVFVIPIYCTMAGAGWTALAMRLARQHEARVAPAMDAAAIAVLTATAFLLVRSNTMAARRYFPEARVVAEYLSHQLRPGDRLVVGPSAGASLNFELQMLGFDWRAYVASENPRNLDSPRILTVLSRVPQLRQPGDGMPDLYAPTFAGAWQEEGVPIGRYGAPRRIFEYGDAEVFESRR
jgi:hypothetical protein